jgi:exodeoxyribonuclease V beta subunit
MEFHFPSAGSASEDLFQTIRNGKGGYYPDIVTHQGFMTGFIDLIVEQEGKFYILDYKSNHLGDNRDDYGKEQLDRAMVDAGYDLQAYIYTVALVKYLRSRVPDFDYERHIGGVAYLFVRGMEKGAENGIWFHKPDQKRVATLEKKLGRV